MHLKKNAMKRMQWKECSEKRCNIFLGTYRILEQNEEA